MSPTSGHYRAGGGGQGEKEKRSDWTGMKEACWPGGKKKGPEEALHLHRFSIRRKRREERKGEGKKCILSDPEAVIGGTEKGEQ